MSVNVGANSERERLPAQWLSEDRANTSYADFNITRLCSIQHYMQSARSERVIRFAALDAHRILGQSITFNLKFLIELVCGLSIDVTLVLR